MRLEAVANEQDALLVLPQGAIPIFRISQQSFGLQKGSAMNRMLSWSSRWQSWTKSTQRSRIRRCATSRLEALEARLNLAAVLVVETADAYWLIEEPSSDSLAPSSQADDLYGEDYGGGCWEDDLFVDYGLAQELPSSVTPVTSNGHALDATKATLTSSLLAELWSSEPDFFYEDVLSVKLYDGTTMDALMSSGLFDDGGSDSFNSPSSQTSDRPIASNSSNTATSSTQSASSNFSLANAISNGSAKQNSAVTVNADESDNADLLAAAKAEVASWSKRVEAESVAMSNVGQAAKLETLASAENASQTIAASQVTIETLAPSSRDDSVSDAAALATIESVSTSPTTVVAREMTKSESFFAKFPTFGIVSGTSSMLRFVRGTGDTKQTTSAESGDGNPSTEIENDSLSYSQWASLFGTVSLLGTSLWRNGNNDSRDSLPSFRSKDDRKRPVVC